MGRLQLFQLLEAGCFQRSQLLSAGITGCNLFLFIGIPEFLQFRIPGFQLFRIVLPCCSRSQFSF
ncbi:hypothetical protein D3C73_1251900 [compost metagenome]